MRNNDILRRIRYIFDYDDARMGEIFLLGGRETARPEICDWLKPEEDAAFQPCEDVTLARFLNGLIIDRRGRRDGPQPEPEVSLTNNGILTKLRIALELKADEVLEIMASAGFCISRHELSAFFRKPGQKHYRELKGQGLRLFLQGLQHKQKAT